MFESDRPEAYEKVYEELVPRLASADLSAAARDLGLETSGPRVLVPCLGRRLEVGPEGVTQEGGPAPLNHRIVAAYYLLHGGRGENAGRFVPYRELPGGQDFARSLSGLVEDRLARSFGGRLEALAAASRALGGVPAPELASGDAAFRFPALPGVPLVVGFYDADEEFPAEAKLLYDLTAPNFLDLECLAVLGLLLVQELEEAAAKA
jgi:hypothetical protein